VKNIHEIVKVWGGVGKMKAFWFWKEKKKGEVKHFTSLHLTILLTVGTYVYNSNRLLSVFRI